MGTMTRGYEMMHSSEQKQTYKHDALQTVLICALTARSRRNVRPRLPGDSSAVCFGLYVFEQRRLCG